jgi:hypothetical protein
MIILFVILFIYSCESVDNAQSSYIGSIKGRVYDDSTKAPVYSAKVTSDGISDTLYTDVTGMFYFRNIVMPRGEYNYYILSSKAGYISDTTYVSAKSDITTMVDSILMKRMH